MNKEKLTWEDTMTFTGGGSAMVAVYEVLDSLDFEYQPVTVPGQIAYYALKLGTTIASGFAGGAAGKATGKWIDNTIQKHKSE